MSEESDLEAFAHQLAQQIKRFGEEMRALIFLSMNGACPFCLANIKVESPTIRGIKRALTGDKLTAFVTAEEAEMRRKCIDPHTLHSTDCDRKAAFDMVKATL